MATHAVVMNNGALVTAGPLADLLGGTDSYRIQVDDNDRAIAVLRAIPGVTTVTVRGDDLEVTAPDLQSRDLVSALVTGGVGVTSVNQASRSLEEAFLTMTEGGSHDAAR